MKVAVAPVVALHGRLAWWRGDLVAPPGAAAPTLPEVSCWTLTTQRRTMAVSRRMRPVRVIS